MYAHSSLRVCYDRGVEVGECVLCISTRHISLELSNLRFMELFNDRLFNSADMCSINELECGYNM